MHRLVDSTPGDIPLVPLTPETQDDWVGAQPEVLRAWVRSNGFEAKVGSLLPCPGTDGGLECVLLGLGSEPGLWSWATPTDRLPAGSFAYDPSAPILAGQEAALAWALAAYRFDRYRSADGSVEPALLAWPEDADRESVSRAARAVWLARDLVNTPAGDLGPGELAGAVEELAGRHGARYEVIVGDALLDAGYPAVHAVGRAASRAPRMVDLRWGDEGAPRLTLVGKGVIFDSGGLDLKPADGMKLMKKDMGGAATVIGLAQAIMEAELPVRLRLLVPAVENAVAGNAFRPGDVLKTRKGLTVEVGNTDAEGRLVLCDALCEADSEGPDLIIDFATLTGAARVALGTELPALFTDDDQVADAWLAAGRNCTDELWRLPLHRDYRRHLESPVADLNNISKARFGGAITAALFLSEFVSRETSWAHVDTMAWNESSRPGRPVGGEAFALRSALDMLTARYGS